VRRGWLSRLRKAGAPLADPRGAILEAGGPLLEVRGLSKSFGGVRAVEGCSFAVPAQRVTGLIGPNGAGKTTVIDLVTGFEKPDGGMVRFCGREIQGWPPHRLARLGLVRTFQLPREWPGLTVMENVLIAAPSQAWGAAWPRLLPSTSVRRSDEEDRRRARAILEHLGLLELRNEIAGNLSGGQKRLLEFARIAVARPRLALLDEPMGGVNPVLGTRVAAAITRLVATGVTVLMVEHNLPFVERLCDTVIVMAVGKVIATGPFATLRSNRAVVDAYLGEVAVSA
jgi:ABC-type branched-subunit amino acid transport system ATPase component